MISDASNAPFQLFDPSDIYPRPVEKARRIAQLQSRLAIKDLARVPVQAVSHKNLTPKRDKLQGTLT